MIRDYTPLLLCLGLVILCAGIVALAMWDDATCAEWGPERTEVTYYWDINLKMMMPSYYTTRDCIRRKP